MKKARKRRKSGRVKTSEICGDNGEAVTSVLETSDSEDTIISIMRPKRTMLKPFKLVPFPDFATREIYFYTKEEFESIDIDEECLMYAEHCVEEWNK